MNSLKDWLNIKRNKKTIGIAIYLLILIITLFLEKSIFIIIILVTIIIISSIFPGLYTFQLFNQQITPENYYLKILKNNYIHLDESILIKMFEIRINNHRNFLFTYLALFVTFTFAILSNKNYFNNISIFEGLSLYVYSISLGIIVILVLVYFTFGFDRFALNELEKLFHAKERLKELKKQNISSPIQANINSIHTDNPTIKNKDTAVTEKSEQSGTKL